MPLPRATSTQPDEAAPSSVPAGARRATDRAVPLAFTFATFLFGCVFFQGDGALPIYLVRDLGLSSTFFGLTYTANTLLILALELPLNAATASWSHARTLTVGALLSTAGFAAYALVHGAAAALIA